MITIEIINAPEEYFKGTYNFFKNKIDIGSNKEMDIFLPFPQLPKICFSIYLEKEYLKINIEKDFPSLKVNGKKTTHFKNIKINDILSFEEFSMKIISFQPEVFVSKKEKLVELSKDLDKSKPELIEIITALSQQP